MKAKGYFSWPVLILILSSLPVSGEEKPQEEKESPVSFGISGFVKSDYWIDSRSVVSAREGLFLLFPDRKIPDIHGQDLNGDPSFNFSAITSRIAGRISGPDAFGARTSGMIEADFSGVTNADINGFRLRHAYLKLEWENWDLLLGQWWHPMFGVDVVPTVISLNTGAPFQPFIRNPQATLTYHRGKSRTLFSMIGQRDNASDGPFGVSPEYLRNRVMPNFHLQWIRQTDHHTLGSGIDYKMLRPRMATDSLVRTAETIGTYALMGYYRYRSSMLDIKTKTIWGQNLSEHLMMGGYAERSIRPEDGYVSYTPLNHLSLWGNIVYGRQVQAGLFVGYGQNFGASETIEGRYYGRGHDIAYLYRIAPSVSFISGSLQLSTELEYTAAAYGTPDPYGVVKDHEEVGNLRLLFTAFYFF